MGKKGKKIFRSLPGSVLDFKLKLEDLGRFKQIGRQIYRFRVILGRRIQTHREKKIRSTLWASTGLVISLFSTISPVLTQGVVQIFFFSTDSNSTTQNYPKMIYLKTLII